jgi:streptogramin lyase
MRRYLLRLLFLGCAAGFLLAWPSIAGDVSYVVLGRHPSGDLVRVTEDGRLQKTIASGVGGHGLTVDKSGDYILARVSSLVRVTPSGVVSTIAACPTGSQWMAVAVDSTGNYIVGDNQQHAIWRVSADGTKVDRVATYPVRWPHEMEDIGVMVDDTGNYLVIEGNGFAAALWTVTPKGGVKPLSLHGAVMRSGTAIIRDGAGAYLALSFRDHAVFRITPTGDVAKLATIDGQNLTGLARNPETGELVLTLNFDPSLRKVSADGFSVTNFADLGYASAILAEMGR